MSKSGARTQHTESYYECAPCGYSAGTTVAIGLCPYCGEKLSEKDALD